MFILFGPLFAETARAGAVVDVICGVIGGPINAACAALGILGSTGQKVLATIMLELSANTLWISGAFFNFVVFKTITGFSAFIENTDIIDPAWKVIRDLANMAFIFLLVYIGIGTILKLSSVSTKQLLARVILVALLVNFSLFFTKVVIDASNILTVGFIHGIETVSDRSITTFDQTGFWGVDNRAINLGLSGIFAEKLRFATLFQGGLSGDGSIFKTENFLMTGIFGSIVLLVVAFVFFAISIMLFTRMVILVFVMILSPLAFVLSVIPNMSTHWNKWLDVLIGQAFFAPVFMALTYVTVKIIYSPTFVDPATAGSDDFMDLMDLKPESLGMLFNFLFIITLMVASLSIAKSVASKGAKGAVDAGLKLGSSMILGGGAFVGRQTFGRAGNEVANWDYLKERQAEGGFGGRLASATLNSGRFVSGASFDTRGAPGLSLVTKNAGIDIGKSDGKGGFVDRQEASKKRATKASEKFAKETGGVSGKTKKEYEGAQNALNTARQQYAKNPTVENEAFMNQREAAFNKTKGEREEELQQNRARALQHESDSEIGGILAYMRGGSGAVRGRREGLEKAHDKAVQERNKAGLKENERRLEELKKVLGGDIDNDLKTVEKDLEKSKRDLEEVERNIKSAAGSTAGAGLEKERQDIEREIVTFKEREQTLQNNKKKVGYTEYQTLKKRVEGAKKQKQKDDTKNSIKDLVEEVNKEKGSAGSTEKDSGENKSSDEPKESGN